MNKNLLSSTLTLSALLLIFSSCMRNSYPQFTGKIHQKVQKEQKFVSVRKTPAQPEQTVSLSKLTEEQPVLASVDMQPQIVTPENFIPKISLSYTSAARTHSSLESKKEIQADNTIVSTNSTTKANTAGNRSNHSIMRTGDQLLCAIISIFIPFLGVALYEDGITIHFWIDLILCLLFWIPGIIYALIVILAE